MGRQGSQAKGSIWSNSIRGTSGQGDVRGKCRPETVSKAAKQTAGRPVQEEQQIAGPRNAHLPSRREQGGAEAPSGKVAEEEEEDVATERPSTGTG